MHQCTQKICALQTVLEAKREEFMDDASIYAKSLCEELEISLEPPKWIRKKCIFGDGDKPRDEKFYCATEMSPVDSNNQSKAISKFPPPSLPILVHTSGGCSLRTVDAKKKKEDFRNNHTNGNASSTVPGSPGTPERSNTPNNLYQNGQVSPVSPEQVRELPVHKPKLVFHCQQAQGSPTGIISGFTNIKELYQKISECYDFPVSDVSTLFTMIND
ncbi:PDZ domain-containing protein GIPC1 [Trichonephila clavipes]|nr:PDZ domain-containing protein GIPC1 [Trichonephila clavipes]